jgi:hypothetical protein
MLWGFLVFESRLAFPVWGRSEPFCRDLVFCLQNGSGTASPAYKMVWPQTLALQNGVACQLSWSFFIHKHFPMFIQKLSNMRIHDLQKEVFNKPRAIL